MTRRTIVGLGVLCAALAAWGIERLIVTDKEAIEAIVEAGARAVERGDWDAVAAIFDDEVVVGGKDKRDAVKRLRAYWEASGATSLSTEVRDLVVSGDQASARIRAWPGGRGLAYGEGTVTWVRRPGGWKATGIANAQVGTGFRR